MIAAPKPIAWSLTVRPARPLDLDQLEAMLDRCSPDTQYRRFHGAVGPAVRRELRRIATPVSDHRSWVATDGTAIHGTATLAWGSDGVVEAAFLVEDGWSHHGVGRELFRAVADEARASHVDVVTAWVQADNQAARKFFRAMVPTAVTTFTGGGELEITIPVEGTRTDRPHSTFSHREIAS
jgi:L-amino acid N-acyltransferase YncA